MWVPVGPASPSAGGGVLAIRDVVFAPVLPFWLPMWSPVGFAPPCARLVVRLVRDAAFGTNTPLLSTDMRIGRSRAIVDRLDDFAIRIRAGVRRPHRFIGGVRSIGRTCVGVGPRRRMPDAVRRQQVSMLRRQVALILRRSVACERGGEFR
ncbi:hypothetical protein D5S18_06435 [Nocardia panacis]|uniref:Uncharacterized protein n=1 Tax=Nocardia panacis TaxID=2340916 RepID=A0A3A4K8Z3_9NOCA|nr:hypothetical protein D5S18_06435 [Nocardia panacis]